MQNHRYPLMIGGTLYSVEEQLNGALAQRLMIDNELVGYCLCRGESQVGLGIRVIRRPERLGYRLARAPGTADKHSWFCMFHSPGRQMSGLASYIDDAIVESPDGFIEVHLGKNLIRSDEHQKVQDHLHNPSKRRRLSLQALLNLLWAESKLNFWYDSEQCRRRMGLVMAEIRRTSTRCYSQGQPLSEHLLIGAVRGSQADTSNAQVAAKALKAGDSVILIGMMQRYDPRRHAHRIAKLPIMGVCGVATVFLSDQKWRQAQKQYANELELWQNSQAVVVVARLVLTEAAPFIYANVKDIALMALSDAWMPVSSTIEVTIEKKLRSEKHTFLKPLRYDAPKDYPLPNFWVIQGSSEHPIPINLQ